MNRLRDSQRDDAPAVLVTGATGLLGSLLTATLLRETAATVVTPVRDKHTEDGVWEPIAEELALKGVADPGALRERLIVTRLPELDKMLDLALLCEQHGVTEIVHAAGSVDYFKKHVLDEANIQLTRRLLDLGEKIGLQRFVFISTAFASGFSTDAIDESLHDEPDEDPTEYTRSKRLAEHVVADSGVPYLILRPSVVVGDSVDGHYRGKPYGVYQFYGAGERLLADKYHPELHIVAPRAPLQVVHQDAFCDGFLQSCRFVEDGGVVHLVSHRDALPTMRDLLDAGMPHLTPFEKVYIYDKLEHVPLKELTRRMRMMVEFAAVNTEIATHPWRFSTATMDALRERGAAFADANRESIGTCLRWFIENSERFQAHKKKFADKQDVVTEYIEVTGPAQAQAAS
jgi:nucleoside-diphosphate-sugar epimerase